MRLRLGRVSAHHLTGHCFGKYVKPYYYNVKITKTIFFDIHTVGVSLVKVARCGARSVVLKHLPFTVSDCLDTLNVKGN